VPLGGQQPLPIRQILQSHAAIVAPTFLPVERSFFPVILTRAGSGSGSPGSVP
jgi:hypothetical protein